MFERFSERARQVIVLAQEEARICKHDYIGTEHILLGVLREEKGLGARALESLEITVESARMRVLELVGQGKEAAPSQLPFTPRAKKVLELGMQEADALDEDQMSSHHLLLGLLREGEGVANRVLLDCGAEPERLRRLVLAGLDDAPQEQSVPAETRTRLVVQARPGKDSAGSPPANLATAVCSFCGKKTSHLFGSDGPTTAWICEECLELFHENLSRQRDKSSGEEPSPDPK